MLGCSIFHRFSTVLGCCSETPVKQFCSNNNNLHRGPSVPRHFVVALCWLADTLDWIDIFLAQKINQEYNNAGIGHVWYANSMRENKPTYFHYGKRRFELVFVGYHGLTTPGIYRELTFHVGGCSGEIEELCSCFPTRARLFYSWKMPFHSHRPCLIVYSYRLLAHLQSCKAL